MDLNVKSKDFALKRNIFELNKSNAQGLHFFSNFYWQKLENITPNVISHSSFFEIHKVGIIGISV